MYNQISVFISMLKTGKKTHQTVKSGRPKYSHGFSEHLQSRHVVHFYRGTRTRVHGQLGGEWLQISKGAPLQRGSFTHATLAQSDFYTLYVNLKPNQAEKKYGEDELF